MKAYVIKIGGNVIDNPELLDTVLNAFSTIQAPKVLIHGGGKIASVISKELGIEPIMVDGRRVTDENTLRVVTMVYGGLINKSIVGKLQSKNCNSIGLTGADANIIKSHKRVVKDVDYGFVGDVDEVNGNFIASMMNKEIAPVIAPLTHDKKGNILNTNADTMASETAIALSHFFEVELVYCFELKGVLETIENPESVIPTITPDSYEVLKNDGVVNKGMIPKLDNCFHALNKGVSSVRICHAEDLANIFAKVEFGTLLTK